MAAVAIIKTSSSHPGNGDSDVARAAAGDRSAFERLYRQHVNRVFSLCARMVGDRVARGGTDAGRLRPRVGKAAPLSWESLVLDLAASTHGQCRAQRTEEQKDDSGRASRENDEDGGMDALPGVVGTPLPPGDLLDLEDAMTRLPPGARRVFVLHDVEGYKHEEIAEMLGVTSGATKAQLHRATAPVARGTEPMTQPDDMRRASPSD